MNSRNSPATVSHGFTPIELLVVVAIISILAAIAVPAYTKHMIKSRRANAQSFLMEIAAREEYYFIDSRAYTSSLSSLSLTAPAVVTKHYAISIDAVDVVPPTFIAKATPLVGSPQNGDGVLSIDHTGVKMPASSW